MPDSNFDDSYYRHLLEQVIDVVCHVQADGQITYCTPSAEIMMGTPVKQIIGTNVLDAILEEDRPIVLTEINRLHSGEITQGKTRVRVHRTDGRIIWIETNAKLSTKGDGTIVVMRDITERKQLEDELARLALEDGLTGLGNRRLFDQTLESEWKRTFREQSEMGLLMIDVDHFKQFNDEYGHQAGDDCLRTLARCIRSALRRPGDSAFRYGGEEMAVVMAGTSLSGAVQVAESVRTAVAALEIPHIRSASADFVTVSIGVAGALVKDGGTTHGPEGLVQAADHALYRAKKEGRNRVADALLFRDDSTMG